MGILARDATFSSSSSQGLKEFLKDEKSSRNRMRLVEKILTIIQGSFEFFLGIIEDSLKKFPEKIP